MNDKLLVLGTIAYDSIETPNIKTGKILGGCATYIGLAASKFKTNCCLVSIVGEDFDKSHINLLESKKLDLSGVEIVANEKTFYWKGKYHENLNKRTTLETQLNVLTKFHPKIPKNFLDSSIVVLGNVDPNIQLAVLDQIVQPKLIVMDTMNFWIESYRDKLNELIKKVDLISLETSTLIFSFAKNNIKKGVTITETMVDVSVHKIDNATSALHKKAIRFDAVPPGQLPRTIMPRAKSGGILKILINKYAARGITVN